MGLLGFAALQGGSNLLGNALNATFTHQENKTNRNWQAQQSELAYQRDLEMWNKNNEYNTPAAQMQRFTDAGLNPNLIYGRGTSGNSNNMPHYTPAQSQGKVPHFDFSQLGSMLNTYQNFKLGKAQEDNLRKDYEIKGVELAGKLLGLEGKKADNARAKMRNKVLNDTLDSQIRQIKMNVDQTASNISYTNARTDATDAETNMKKLNYQKSAHDFNMLKGMKVPSNTPFQYIMLADVLRSIFDNFKPSGDNMVTDALGWLFHGNKGISKYQLPQ